MPGNTRPTSDERDNLLAYLEQERYVLRLTAHGLTDEQARAIPTVSVLSVGGLLKHVASVERYWIGLVVGRPPEVPTGDAAAQAYDAGFRLDPGATLAGVLADYAAAARETDDAVASIPDLGRPVPVPRDAPWFPADVEAWSVRWVLGHLIAETARHAGHADIVREAIDGATAFPLMAAAESWPATPWLQPWEPHVGA